MTRVATGTDKLPATVDSSMPLPKASRGTSMTKIVLVALAVIAVIATLSAAAIYAEIKWHSVSFVLTLGLANPIYVSCLSVMLLGALITFFVVGRRNPKNVSANQHQQGGGTTQDKKHDHYTEKTKLSKLEDGTGGAHASSTSNPLSHSSTRAESNVLTSTITGGEDANDRKGTSRSQNSSPVHHGATHWNRGSHPASPSGNHRGASSTSKRKLDLEGTNALATVNASTITLEDFKAMFPSLRIYDETFWAQHCDLNGIAIDFSDLPPLDEKVFVAKLLEIQTTLGNNIKDHAGISVVCVPKGITPNLFLTLLQLVDPDKERPMLNKNGEILNEPYRAPFTILNEQVLKELGDHPAEKSYRVVITNHIMRGTSGKGINEIQNKMANPLQGGWPELLPSMILAGLSYKEGEKAKWMCDSSPTFVEKMNMKVQMSWVTFCNEDLIDGSHVFISYKEVGAVNADSRTACGIALQFPLDELVE